jgi:hypothetical protein
MVMMQVRAHDVIDLVRPRARGREPVEIGRVEQVPERPPRLDLVVAATAVDQDILAPDLQEPAVHAELYESARRVVMARRQPRGMPGEDMVVEFGKDVAGAISRAIGLLDAGNAGLADRKHSHGSAPVLVRVMRTLRR